MCCSFLLLNLNSQLSFKLKIIRTLKLQFLLILLFGPKDSDSARILLFLGGISSYSHRISLQPLANKLAQRGHEVTFLSPSTLVPKDQHPKVQNLCPDELSDFHEDLLTEYADTAFKRRVGFKFSAKEPVYKMLTQLFDRSQRMCHDLFNSPKFYDWVFETKTLDLIILDSAFNECAYGLAHYFKSKTIIYGSIGTIFFWDVEIFGLPAELSWIPGFGKFSHRHQLAHRMSFWERFKNGLSTFLLCFTYRNYHLPNIDFMLRNNWSFSDKIKDMPPLEKLIQKTDLMLLNQHFSDQFPRPYPPFVVAIGGMHLLDVNSTLPQEMETFIESNGDVGFIYVSFGSLLKMSTMPKNLLEKFFIVMRTLKALRFLVKWDGKKPENVSDNILFKSWFPQDHILAHPKIRGFITQGGQVSLQQAIFYHVPIIMMPVHGDQDYNAQRMRLVGHGIAMELADLTTIKLEDAIRKLLTTDDFKVKGKILREACRDRPMSALDTATWWTEYILRTPNTNLLKPLSMRQPLWIQWSGDVWTFIFLVLGTIILTFCALIKFILIKIQSKRQSNPIKDKSSRLDKYKKGERRVRKRLVKRRQILKTCLLD